MLRQKDDLSDVTGVVGERAIERLHHRVGFLPDVDSAQEIVWLQRIESTEHALPALLPPAEKFLARRLTGQFELLIAMPVWFLAVRGKEIREARPHVARDVLHQDRNGIRFRIERNQELLVGNLYDRPFRHALITAELAPDFFEKPCTKCVHCSPMIP